MRVRRAQCQELVAGGFGILADQHARDPQERPAEQPDVLPQETWHRGVGEQRVDRGPALLPVRHVTRGTRAGAAAARLGVEHDGGRRRHRAVARPGDPPAEVDVVVEQRQVGVEPVELVPHVAADQHARGVDREHVARPVVLAGIRLAGLEAGLARARCGDRQADLQQAAQRGPLTDLGAHGRDVRCGGRRVEQARTACPGAPTSRRGGARSSPYGASTRAPGARPHRTRFRTART